MLTLACHDCHKTIERRTGPGAAGYATTPDGDVCYPCADARQRKELAARPPVFYAYVSSAGEAVTTWTGGSLASITDYAEHDNGWHAGTIARFRAVDDSGQWWQGRGAGRGMCCTLRPMKAPR